MLQMIDSFKASAARSPRNRVNFNVKKKRSKKGPKKWPLFPLLPLRSE
jgi:hypothetical protein